MDININLSDYYESILSDQMTTVVLTWIEKSGSITELEIINELGIEKSELKHIVLRLYRNQLIEIAHDFLTITKRGKVIIDNLDLSDEIIKNSYMNMAFKASEKKFINKSIHWYRDNHYHLYLKTFTALKYWNRFHSAQPQEDDESNKRSINYTLIIFYDLIEAFLEFENKTVTYKKLLGFINPKAHSLPEELSYTQKAYNLLVDFTKIKNKDELNDMDTSLKEIYLFLQCKNYFISDFNKQHQINECLYSEKKQSEANILFWNYTDNAIAIDHIFPLAPSGLNANAFWKNTLRKTSNTVLDELVFIVENSSSLAEVSSVIHKSEAETRDLLLRLNEGVHDILSGKKY